MVQRVRKGIVYIFLADKMQSIIELQISRKTPSSPAANSSSLCCHCGSETHTVFFPFPAPRQLHLSSLPEKVWNKLEVGPQNKQLWQAVKPVWNTHTTVGPKRETKSSKSILWNLFLAYLIVRSVYMCWGGRETIIFLVLFSI